VINKIEININNLPLIEGLRVRKFVGEADFPAMITIIEAASKPDNQQVAITLEEIRHDYQHLNNSDPYQDMIIVEIKDTPIAYSRVEWYQEEEPNDRIYQFFVHITPEWRYQGIEDAMIRWSEARLLTIASDHPLDSERFFQTYSFPQRPGFNQILESFDYKIVRYAFEMSRSLVNIPTAELPKGIEVRPVIEEDWRKVWEASIEAFRDHWGYSEPPENEFESYKSSKYFQPDLWQVAWHGNDVVGSVMNYIDHDYNQKYDRKRGWTESITTKKEWRSKGIASALIVSSMHMHKALGMTEVGLGVDTNNPTGALHVYQKLGYHEDKTMFTYRKTL